MTPNAGYLLIVDDDSVARYIARRVVKDAGYAGPLKEADDGSTAIDLIESAGCPSFILLDICMPRVDGHQLLEWLATRFPEDPPPVVMLSSSGRQEDVDRAVAYPFVRSFQEKPLTRDAFLQFARLGDEATVAD